MVELSTQLSTLRQLHRELLPKQIPEPAGWHVAVHYWPSLWPGGDYYDVRKFPDGRVLFFVADASDQGAAATALAILIRAVLHSCPLSSGIVRAPFCPFSTPVHQPSHVFLEHLNGVVSENKLEEQFMTAFCGVLDPEDGILTFANAGHPYPLWWRAARRTVEMVESGVGCPLGVMRHASYPQFAILMNPGDLLVLYCDSVTASLNRGTQRYSWTLVDDAVREAAPSGARAVLSALVDRRARSPERTADADEATVMIIEREPSLDSRQS
jgi:sigma-B regulation protein RsbU (phosphoserine phosphatase)